MTHETEEAARDPAHPIERLKRHWAASRPVVIGAVALLCIATLGRPEDEVDPGPGAETIAHEAYFDEGLGGLAALPDAPDDAPVSEPPPRPRGFAALSTPSRAGDPFRRFR